MRRRTRIRPKVPTIEARAAHDEWRDAVLRRDNYRCRIRWDRHCTERADHVHHVILRSRGGRDDIENGIATCADCHRRVHDNPAEATARGFMASYGADLGDLPWRVDTRPLLG